MKISSGVTCTLEKDTAAPAIIDNTAGLETGVSLLIKGGLYHAGQLCVSVQRIITHKDIVNKRIEKLVKSVNSLRLDWMPFGGYNAWKLVV